MERNEFVQRAMIAVGAALVKCYDEKCDGIIGNDENQYELSLNAHDIALQLLDRAVESEIID